MRKTLLLLVISFGSISADIATSPLQFLKMGEGPRTSALGGAYVGLSDDADSVLLNPAGLAKIEGKQIRCFYNSYLANIKAESISYTHRFEEGEKGFGLNILFLHTPEIDRMGSDGEKDGDFTCYDLSLSFGYGMRVTPDIAVGSSIRYVRESLDDISVDTACFNLGLLFETPYRNLTVGAVLSNIGKGVKFIEKEEDLPITLRTGISLKTLDDTLTLTAQIEKSIDSPITFGCGAEHKVLKSILLRAGYSSSQDIGSGLSLGIGLALSKFIFDISFTPYSDLGNTTSLSLCLQFLPED
jgi:hypothetical protein